MTGTGNATAPGPRTAIERNPSPHTHPTHIHTLLLHGSACHEAQPPSVNFRVAPRGKNAMWEKSSLILTSLQKILKAEGLFMGS